jgi:hypothetical protein
MKWWQIRKRDADLKRELQSDLELEEEEQRANGLSGEEGRCAARRAFGNTTLALHKLEHRGWIRAHLKPSENNRRAAYCEWITANPEVTSCTARKCLVIGKLPAPPYGSTPNLPLTVCTIRCR